MIIHTRWKRRDQSEFVKDGAEREYEIATFEGGKGPLEPFAPRDVFQAVPFGTNVRASVFQKGGLVQFTIDSVAQLTHVKGALDAVRKEARRRLESGDWEQGASYYVTVETQT